MYPHRYYVLVVEKRSRVATDARGVDGRDAADDLARRLRERYSDHYIVEIVSAKTLNAVATLEKEET